ncbi:MAG: adenosylhomocysteinase [Firmicutes bacterium]|nr:adenosylhomocysteinase [Bacillota bacterium]
MPPSIIRDPRLAPRGHEKIEWAAAHMPVLRAIGSRLAAEKAFAGRRIALSIHLEAKTANLALCLREAGAEVAVTGSNPLSTQDDVAAALVERGIAVFAWHGATPEEYHRHILATLDTGPELIIDDGGDLATALHADRRDLLPRVIGGCEETTTGLRRLRAMAAEGVLGFPMMAVNDARCKHLFDNRYGTGQSVWDGIMRTTNLLVAGKTVVVAGYGWCGRGVAMRARGLGARVIVCEVDPVKALEAVMDGFEVMPSLAAASIGRIFITVTGCLGVFGREHFLRMPDGALLANAGHFDVEVAKNELAELAVRVRRVRANVDEYELSDGKRLYLLAEGRLVNLAAGDGHPVEIMDLSFAVQAMALRYLFHYRHELPPGVHPVPATVDEEVARLALAAMGISIDTLTPEQQKYLESWQEAF